MGLLIRLANFVKLPHTVFAMPFTLVGVLLASARHRVTLPGIGWILLAFTAARFAAMGFNRIVDRNFDALNPRTAMRELPSGALTLFQARVSVVVASSLFIVSSWQLNTLCLMLSPIALAWILGYSYSKRFTRLSHIWLGLGLSIAPVAGYLAITGRWSEPWWLLCTLAMAVLTWSGGFDILYALQDAEFDRDNKLFSIPSTIGVSGAIKLSRILHVISVVCLSLLVLGDPLGVGDVASTSSLHSVATTVQVILGGGVLLVAAMLVWEHRLVRSDSLEKLDAAFFYHERAYIHWLSSGCVICANRRPAVIDMNTDVSPAGVRHPLVVAITGASGAPYALRLIQQLVHAHVPTWLIVSSHGLRLLQTETDVKSVDTLRQYCGANDFDTCVKMFDDADRGALPASGSARSSGMVICPCSMGTVSAIAHGSSRSLVERSADVALKERRKLVLVPRETPMSIIHLENLAAVTRAGAVVLPASPGFYHRPSTLEDLVDFVVARVLDQLDVDHSLGKRWGEGSE